MSRSILSEEAQAEFDEAAVFYENRHEGLGFKFVDAVGEAVERIVDAPEMWQRVAHDCRRCRVNSFPYDVIYRIDDEIIRVFDVAHLHRQEDFWASRVY